MPSFNGKGGPKRDGVNPIVKGYFRSPLWRYTTAVGTRVHNYKEVRECLEKEHPDWLRALTLRHIKAPADYWPQKVLAVSSANAAMQNYVSICEHQTKPIQRLLRSTARRRKFAIGSLEDVEEMVMCHPPNADALRGCAPTRRKCFCPALGAREFPRRRE